MSTDGQQQFLFFIRLNFRESRGIVSIQRLAQEHLGKDTCFVVEEVRIGTGVNDLEILAMLCVCFSF